MKKGDLYKRGRVDKVFNVDIKTDYICPGYSILHNNESYIGETGLLTVFEISSDVSTDPVFNGRWDENLQVLDIDIFNVDRNTATKFKGKKDGYTGHHTLRTDKESRIFRVHIEIEGKKYFKGDVFFNTNHTIKIPPLHFKLNFGI